MVSSFNCESYMSTSRDTITSPASKDLMVTSFYGGADRGKCIQLTQRNDRAKDWLHVAVDKEQAIKLIADLAVWLSEGMDDATYDRIDEVLDAAAVCLPERWKV